LVPRPLDKGPRPKSGKLRLNLHGTGFGGKINWFRPKKVPKGELLIWRTKNQAIRTKVQSNPRIQFASNESKLVPRKLDRGPSSKVGLRWLRKTNPPKINVDIHYHSSNTSLVILHNNNNRI